MLSMHARSSYHVTRVSVWEDLSICGMLECLLASGSEQGSGWR